MRISKSTLLAGLGCLIIPSTSLGADVVTFSGDGTRLSGTLHSIDGDGIIEWTSPFSSKPLKLRTERLQQVEFPQAAEKASGTTPIMVTLRNGDQLPTLSASEWSEGGLVTETSIAGAVTIPRTALSSAQFGIQTDAHVYRGPQNLREWTTGRGEPGNWRLRGQSLVSSGQSVAARDFELPEDFTLRFKLEWDTRSPNISCTFADPLAKSGSAQDFYRFNFDSSGIRIARHQKKQSNSSHRTLAQWQRRPSQFPGKMQVDIRVSRSKGQLELLIDGESEGLIMDPLLPLPTGSGVSFSCVTHDQGSQTIRNIEILELNSKRARHLAEERGKADRDSLITIDDDRWSGELISIRPVAGEPHLVFKTSFSESPWEIPQLEISTLFFAQSTPDPDPKLKGRFVLEFQGNGKLSASRCVIEDDSVRITHPLIGPMNLQREAIRLIRRVP